MSVTEWMRFVRGVAKVEKNLKFSELTAKECFLLSRMVVVDEDADHGRHRQLSFEDFLEATVRLTEMMSQEGEEGEEKPEEKPEEGRSAEGKVDGKWDYNDPDAVSPVLNQLVESILSKYDRDGHGGVSRAEGLHNKLHGRNTKS
jgi:hypothetical protein